MARDNEKSKYFTSATRGESFLSLKSLFLAFLFLKILVSVSFLHQNNKDILPVINLFLTLMVQIHHESAMNDLCEKTKSMFGLEELEKLMCEEALFTDIFTTLLNKMDIDVLTYLYSIVFVAILAIAVRFEWTKVLFCIGTMTLFILMSKIVALWMTVDCKSQSQRKIFEEICHINLHVLEDSRKIWKNYFETSNSFILKSLAGIMPYVSFVVYEVEGTFNVIIDYAGEQLGEHYTEEEVMKDALHIVDKVLLILGIYCCYAQITFEKIFWDQQGFLSPLWQQFKKPKHQVSMREESFSENVNFLHAISYGDKDRVKKILKGEGNFDINYQCLSTGNTGIHIACATNQYVMMQVLLDNGKGAVNMNLTNKEKKTPLVIAAEKDLSNFINRFLKMKKLSLSDGNCDEAIVAAVESNHFEIAQKICRRMSELNIKWPNDCIPSCINRCVSLSQDLKKSRLSERSKREIFDSINKYQNYIITQLKKVDKDVNIPKMLNQGKYITEDHSPVDVLREMECPICLEVMRSGIKRCHNDHWMCEACADQVNECPCCRVKFSKSPPTKCVTGEKIINKFLKVVPQLRQIDDPVS